MEFSFHPGNDLGLLGHPGIFQQFCPGRGCVNVRTETVGVVGLEVELGFLEVGGIGIGGKSHLVEGLIPLLGETEETIGRFVGSEIVGRLVDSERIGKLVGFEMIDRLVGLERIGRLVGLEMIGKLVGSVNVGRFVGLKAVYRNVGLGKLDRFVGLEIVNIVDWEIVNIFVGLQEYVEEPCGVGGLKTLRLECVGESGGYKESGLALVEWTDWGSQNLPLADWGKQVQDLLFGEIAVWAQEFLPQTVGHTEWNVVMPRDSELCSFLVRCEFWMCLCVGWHIGHWVREGNAVLGEWVGVPLCLLRVGNAVLLLYC